MALVLIVAGTEPLSAESMPLGLGWARTKVNCTIFRHNAVCSRGGLQFTAYYDPDGRLILARRRLDSRDWETRVTPWRGGVADAHNSISLAIDGAGYLHLSWDHHGHPLRYCRSTAPWSLELTDKLPMVGTLENRVTYPEFYNLPEGDLLFFYRDGSSGNGNLVLNRYLAREQRWIRVQNNLLDGEGQRNAYWQTAVDPRSGAIHLSWVWRETGDVRTNHDLAYARSDDGGQTWRRSDGAPLAIPIREATAEYAVRIPQDSELANQTSMAVDPQGRPCIATFWRAAPHEVPQYRVVWHDGTAWQMRQVGQRTLNFHRSGGGTKRPPISRPVILIDPLCPATRVLVLFRDGERDRKLSVALCDDLETGDWSIVDLTPESVGQADPLYDPDVWAEQGRLHLFTQFVGQGDSETEEAVPPQPVSILEVPEAVWRPDRQPVDATPGRQ